MKQDEARKTKHHHTPSIKARQPGRHMKQPDTQREGPAQKLARTPQGTNRRGEGDNSKRGRGAPHSPAKNHNKEAPPHRRWHTQAKEKTTAKTQAETPTRKNTTQRSHSTRGTEENTKNKPRARKAPKKRKLRGPGGGQDHKKASKKTPTPRQQVGAGH